MPVNRVGKYFRWGQKGKLYPTYEQALRQGRAIVISQMLQGGQPLPYVKETILDFEGHDKTKYLILRRMYNKHATLRRKKCQSNLSGPE